MSKRAQRKRKRRKLAKTKRYVRKVLQETEDKLSAPELLVGWNMPVLLSGDTLSAKVTITID